MIFPTFCHISEYWPHGYRRLDLMLAASDPLYLWAPSSYALRELTPVNLPLDGVLTYIAEGRIRLIGRRGWFFNGPGRQALAQAWPGARWDESVDGRIREICEQDQDRPFNERRVTIAPDEDGWTWAAERLAERPEMEQYWHGIVTGERPQDRVPEGVLEAVDRARRQPHDEQGVQRGDPYRAARAVLRDARNHLMAIVACQAEAPFFLHRTDPIFYQLVGSAHDAALPAAVGTAGTRHGTPADVTAQLLELLGRLGSVSGPNRLADFIAGPGHAELAAWTRMICDQLRAPDAEASGNHVVHVLRESFRSGRFDAPVRRLLDASGNAAVALGQFVMSATDVLLTGPEVYGESDCGAAALAAPGRLVRDMKQAWPQYAGPQWPFLYVYGEPPTPSRVRYLARVVERLSAGRKNAGRVLPARPA